MESAIRYDFSFPPKSSSLNSTTNTTSTTNSTNANNNNNTGHVVHRQVGNNGYTNNNLGLPKSASTSLLTCSSHNSSKLNNNYCNNCNNCNNNNNNIMQNNLNMTKNNCMTLNNKQHESNPASHHHHQQQQQHNVIKPSALGLQQHHHHHHHQIGSSAMHHVSIVNSITQSIAQTVAQPQTPKDSNCSFTFDDLKNTLAFMEDSPLIKQIGDSHHHNQQHQQVLMVNPNAVSNVESALSSSSSVCSSSSVSSSSSCNSCCAPSYLPKSNSNPMLLSIATGSTSSSSLSRPSSPQSNSTLQQMLIHQNDSAVSNNNLNNRQYNQQQTSNNSTTTNTSVLDLFLNKKQHTDCSDNNNSQYDTSTASSNNNSLITTANSQCQPASGVNGINSAVESAAKKYRCAAQITEATCCWKGKLPPKQYKTPIVYSTKVFVGGLPWDITEEDLCKEFGVFGPCRVEWTNKEKFNMLSSGQVQIHPSEINYENNNSQYNNNNQQRNNNNNRNSLSNMNNNSNSNSSNNNSNNANNGSDQMNGSKHRLSPGFAYVIYESEYSVRSLVGNCIEDYQNGRDRVEYYFKISTRRVRNKEVQIIPWILADNNFALCAPKELDPKKTIFVGNLHGTMTARDLAHIMNELFGCVVYSGIDIDKLKYPIGSGRVTFSHQQNFMRAVRAAFVDIQSSKFSKRIQIDPYLEDVQCCLCYTDKGIYFCRDFQCFNYYCGCCWDEQHPVHQSFGNHKPLMRKREDNPFMC